MNTKTPKNTTWMRLESGSQCSSRCRSALISLTASLVLSSPVFAATHHHRGSAPTSQALPTVSPSNPIVGTSENGTTGTWTGSPTYTYQWKRADTGTPISGATSTSYTPVAGDVGHTLSITVTATNAYGSTSATSSATSAVTSGGGSSGGGSSGGDTPFAALHTYYLSPTGSDANSGLDAAHPWATPNHAVKCGDVIVAAPGAYGTSMYFGAVSNCPSTSGGIDGNGGVYFAVLLCGGSGLGASDGCAITKSAGRAAVEIQSNNWAVEGWTVNGGGVSMAAFEVYACNAVVHHVAFINDIAFNALQGYDTNDCGKSGGPNTYGGDYFAVVGSIAQNAAQDAICLAAVDSVGPGVLDTNPGTHVYFYGNFSYANANPNCRNKYDTEDFMFDTWGAHQATYQGVVANNMGWSADRMCVQLFNQQATYAPTIKIYNNTCFRNNLNSGSDWMDGEIHVASTVSPNPWGVYVTNNIARQTLSAGSGGGGVSAFAVGNTMTAFANGGSGSENVYRAANSSCKASNCNSTFDAESWDGTAGLGTNTYVDPAFYNTSDLLSNWVGAPNCVGKENVTQCMGYDAYRQTIVSNTPIYDLRPSASGASAKGYQVPSTNCSANADFPTWLKGVVYLHWTGSTVVQRHGLVTTPCGL